MQGLHWLAAAACQRRRVKSFRQRCGSCPSCRTTPSPSRLGAHPDGSGDIRRDSMRAGQPSKSFGLYDSSLLQVPLLFHMPRLTAGSSTSSYCVLVLEMDRSLGLLPLDMVLKHCISWAGLLVETEQEPNIGLTNLSFYIFAVPTNDEYNILFSASIFSAAARLLGILPFPSFPVSHPPLWRHLPTLRFSSLNSSATSISLIHARSMTTPPPHMPFDVSRTVVRAAPETVMSLPRASELRSR
ncbi:hypothetical protein MIND_01374600 [Mycena indigotica]|uniref:Uncharacterized protein n=1 Tax=Mycena indigotica TaxID=2126181 RepID=A0A8H6RZA8_9AGAR|nr:uncharacterized protein MIND_01374600 [Mycena indigotica]KAF7289136.1 hypothetical protein MIND_01374600 [Mycena indigotica]